MKNTIKMSLVAALAVAGLSTTASAGGLEEAIKGVTISGKMEVEYDYSNFNSGAAGATDVTGDVWDLDWDLTAKVPVNENVTAVFGMEADTGISATNGGAIQTGSAGTVAATEDNNVSTTNSGTYSDAKTESTVNVTKLYFQYANGPVTAMVGKQGMAGAPWFDDERANGVVGIFNAGPVAVAAAHFTNVNGHTVVQNNDTSAAAIIAGNIADTGINASLWYAQVSDTLNSYSFDVNGKVADMVNFDLRHTSVDLDELASGAEASLTKAVVSADIDMFNVRVGYGMTNDDTVLGAGGLVNLESSDNDAATTFGLEQLNIADLNDADVYLIGAGVKMGALSLNLDYIDGSFGNGANNDFDELFFQADYKMSKNFNIGSHYSTATLGKADSDVASVSLEYKF